LNGSASLLSYIPILLAASQKDGSGFNAVVGFVKTWPTQIQSESKYSSSFDLI